MQGWTLQSGVFVPPDFSDCNKAHDLSKEQVSSSILRCLINAANQETSMNLVSMGGSRV